MISRLMDRIRTLGSPRILVVGDLILDRYVWGRVRRISPEAPIPVLEAGSEEYRPGGAANVACNLATLGARTALAGAVGNDSRGRILRNLLRKHRIDISAVVRTSKPTPTKSRMMAHHQQMLRVDEEDASPLSPVDARKILLQIRSLNPGIRLAVLSDYNKGTLVPFLARQVISRFRKLGLPIIAALKSREWSRYRGATGGTLNREELFALTGGRKVERGADELRRKLGLKFLVVTLGEQGLLLFEADRRPLRIPTEARQVFDVTGAGDTMLAAFSLGHACGWPLEDCARLGNIAAGIVVGKVGTATVTADEVLRHLAGHPAMERKLLPLASLKRRIAAERERGRRVVFTNGCFDLIHSGHVQLLRFAKGLGDVVVAAINSDASVRRLKGPTRPILPAEERARILEAMEAVDYVTIFDDDTPVRTIRELRPDILVKGEDAMVRPVPGAREVEGWGGKVVFAPTVPGRSTSEIVRSVLERHPNGR